MGCCDLSSEDAVSVTICQDQTIVDLFRCAGLSQRRAGNTGAAVSASAAGHHRGAKRLVRERVSTEMQVSGGTGSQLEIFDEDFAMVSLGVFSASSR